MVLHGRRRRALLAAAIAAAAFAAVSYPAAIVRADTGSAPFAFALIGDIPYNALEVRMLERVFGAFDQDLAFALHVGDLKSGGERCDGQTLGERRALLATSPVPLVFIPGDNEWTDCARPSAGSFDPLGRLEWLREQFYAPARPLGGSDAAADELELVQQAQVLPGGPPENLRWQYRGVMFITLNLPGSNNGLNAKGLDRSDMHTRERFNARWLRESYAQASREGATAVVVVGHANPNFGRDTLATAVAESSDAKQSRTLRRDAYRPFRSLLRELSEDFDGPTLFLHGDTHRHRIDRITPKLLRVESYGSPFSNLWLRIDFDPSAAPPFTISSRRSDEDDPLP